MKLVSGSKVLDLQAHAAVVAILNVTPDSYYDGGRNLGSAALLRSAETAVEGGAEILEIGGESTGPDSGDVSADEEERRVLPAVRALRKAFPAIWIAVDTTKSTVAEAALRSGADMINDVSAGRADPAIFSVISEHRCPVVLMYSKDPTPRTTRRDVRYDDVLATIRTFLLSRIAQAKKEGIEESRIILDPGLGHFVSSDPAYSFEILRRLRELTDLGPILVSPSRKSFLAGPENLPPSKRLPATLEASVLAVSNGALLIRTHDPKETREVLARGHSSL